MAFYNLQGYINIIKDKPGNPVSEMGNISAIIVTSVVASIKKILNNNLGTFVPDMLCKQYPFLSLTGIVYHIHHTH